MSAQQCSALLRASVLRLPKAFLPTAQVPRTQVLARCKFVQARLQSSAGTPSRQCGHRKKHVMCAQHADSAKQVHTLISVY